MVTPRCPCSIVLMSTQKHKKYWKTHLSNCSGQNSKDKDMILNNSCNNENISIRILMRTKKPGEGTNRDFLIENRDKDSRSNNSLSIDQSKLQKPSGSTKNVPVVMVWSIQGYKFCCILNMIDICLQTVPLHLTWTIFIKFICFDNLFFIEFLSDLISDKRIYQFICLLECLPILLPFQVK